MHFHLKIVRSGVVFHRRGAKTKTVDLFHAFRSAISCCVAIEDMVVVCAERVIFAFAFFLFFFLLPL